MVRKMKFEIFFDWFEFFHPCGLRYDWRYETALFGSTLQFFSNGLTILHYLDSLLHQNWANCNFCLRCWKIELFFAKENSTCRLKIIRNCYYKTKGDSGNIFLQWNWHIEIIFCNFDFFQFFLCLLRAVLLYKTFIKSCVFWKNAFFIICWKDIEFSCDIAHADPRIHPKVSLHGILEQFDTWRQIN